MSEPLPCSDKKNLSGIVFTTVLLTAFIFPQAVAQLIEEPVLRTWQHQASPGARTKDSSTPLSLPFWDDFSTAKQYPDTLWVNSNSVWIQDGTGIKAPTLNVATFNGLDSLGSPYSPNEATAKGFGDKLVSRPINLGDGAGGVTPAERNTVFLSFFYQWRGGQEPPDQNDFLRVEFLNNTNEWEAIETIFGNQELKADSFYTKTIAVTGNQFFHDKFQFRLRSFGRLSGPFDTWLVDYIYLNKGRMSNDPDDFPDQAVSSNITSIFGAYRSIPLHHFFAANTLTGSSYGLTNLRGSYEPLTYRLNVDIANITGTDTVVTTSVLGDSIFIRRPSSGLNGFEHATVEVHDSLLLKIDNALINPDADKVRMTLTVSVYTGDVEQSNGTPAADYPKYSPLELRQNDTTRNHYMLADYLAYDDGTAEYAVRLTAPGNRLACRFDLPAFPDTLVGFEIYFPYFGGENSQTLDFYVYGDDNGVPQSIPLRTISSRTINKNTSNQFMFIDMRVEPLLLENATFYVGWKEPVSGRVDVGLDKSLDNGDKLYVNTNGTWVQNTEVKGSLMLRPKFGSGTNIPVVGLPEENQEAVIYPNPNKGIFYIEQALQHVEVIDLAGKRVNHQYEETGDRCRISIPAASPGVYIIRWQKNGRLHTQKVVVNLTD